jgi:hypothetical protein
MLRKIFDAFKRAETHQEQINYIELLGDKPFTKNVAMFADSILREAMEAISAIIDSPRDVDQPEGIGDYLESCFVIVSKHITDQSTKRIGVSGNIFVPYESIPSHANSLISFNLFVLDCLVGVSTNEGVYHDVTNLHAKVASGYFKLHNPEERTELSLQAIQQYQRLREEDLGNFSQWAEVVSKMVILFIDRLATEDQELKELDLETALAKALSALLEAT